MQSASLLSLATAVPPRTIEQHEAKARAREAFGGKKALFDRLSGVFDNAGIARRLVVSEGAVEKHNQRIFAKLGLHANGDVHRRVSAVLTLLGA